MVLLLIIMGVVFIGYLIYTYSKFGILDSISESYYKFKENGNKWIFIIFMALLAICLWLIASLNIQPMSWTFFLAGSGAVFVGAAAAYRDKMTEWWHIAATYCLIFFSLLGLVLMFGGWWPTYSLVAGALLMLLFKKKINNYGYWVEILAFVCIYSGLWVEALPK